MVYFGGAVFFFFPPDCAKAHTINGSSSSGKIRFMLVGFKNNALMGIDSVRFFFAGKVTKTNAESPKQHRLLEIYIVRIATVIPGLREDACIQAAAYTQHARSEEHTSELQSPLNLV